MCCALHTLIQFHIFGPDEAQAMGVSWFCLEGKRVASGLSDPEDDEGLNLLKLMEKMAERRRPS